MSLTAKIIKEDEKIFNNLFIIFEAAFQNEDEKKNKIDNQDSNLVQRVTLAFEKLQFELKKTHVLKVKQILYLLSQKTGICLIGHSFAGKTSILRVMKKTLEIHLLEPLYL